jgi:glycosyltransferase involved in cell wall biosynthesis
VIEKKNPLKILLITQYFPPEIGAGSNRAYEHANIWSNLGAKVTVLTCFPNYPDGIIHENYKKYIKLEETINKINVLRTFTYATPNKGVVRRSISYFSFMFSSIIQGYFNAKDHDIIIATSPPITIGISGLVLSKLTKIPLVFDVRDLWPASIVQLGQIRNKYVIKSLEFLEKYIYKHASLIVSVTDSYIPIIEAKGINKKKIKKISNGVDISLFKPLEKDQSLINTLELNNKFIVSYFGTLGLSHSIITILKTAELLINSKDIMFFIIGDGAEKDDLIKYAKSKNINNVKFKKFVEKKELNKYYSISDVMLVPLRNIPLFKHVIPSKIFEIMAMELPLILSVEGEAKEIIRRANSGLLVKPEDPISLKEAIMYLKNNEKQRKKLGSNGRIFVENEFNREILAKKYLEILYNKL